MVEGGGPTAARLEPDAVLLPERRDAGSLVALWLVRRSFFWMLFLGVAVGAIAARVAENSREDDLDVSSPDAVVSGIVTPFGLAFLAVVLRFPTAWVGLALAYPLASEYQRNRTAANAPRGLVATHFDRMLVARALRAFRLTRDVRLTAYGRLGSTGDRLARVDRIIGIGNVAAGVACFVVIAALGSTIEI